MKVKTIIEFSVKGDIEKIVCRWAKRTGFYECSRADAEAFMDYDNITYCYCLNTYSAKTFLSIHQLDNKVRIEVWIAQETGQQKESMQKINDLLIMLGQNPIT